MAEVEVTDLSKGYPTPAAPLEVLKGVDLSLSRGESLAVVGPSGSGKSTLLSILGALDEPTSGAVRIDGVDPFTLDERALARFRAEKIGFVFQEHYLLPQCSVLENVLVPLLADGQATGADADRARELLGRVGLGERLTHRPAELSGGERQRAAVARALIRGPLLVLADEPTGNLDASTADAIADLLLELQREANTILVAVTHSAEFAARMGRQTRLVEGRLVESSAAATP
ncbi:ABC transporter ATP-binding protein [Botrimarina sp.]|uniref:ABC transporter ATP-binding protein n=1 Tax=Botrimarina sp. TaxID=2795802 RepID=UPI0032EB8284